MLQAQPPGDDTLATSLLRLSEASLANILQSMGDAVIAADSGGHVIRMNRRAEELTGWSAAMAIGMPLTMVFRIVDLRSRQQAANPALTLINGPGGSAVPGGDALLIGQLGNECPVASCAAPMVRPSQPRTSHTMVSSLP